MSYKKLLNRQLSLSLKNGELNLQQTKIPEVVEGYTLIKSINTLISPGTEKMLLNFGKDSILNKVLKNKDKVDLVFRSFKANGVYDTLKKINSKINAFTPLGYSNFGIVIESSSSFLKKGDYVISNGYHADYVLVPNLYCKKTISFNDDYLFTILGSIAINSIRKSNIQIGSRVSIIGMGILGILIFNFIKSICHTFCFENNKPRIVKIKKIFEDLNFYDLPSQSSNSSLVDSMDEIFLTASSGDNLSDLCCALAADSSNIIQLGTSNIKLNRDILYKKNINFTVSSSYGLGRNDFHYEHKGIDIPKNISRWTAGRNISEAFNLISKNNFNLSKLINESFDLSNFSKAYNSLNNQNIFTVKFNYENSKTYSIIKVKGSSVNHNFSLNKINGKNNLKAKIIGAGSQSKLLIPKIIKCSFDIQDIISRNPLNSQQIREKFSLKLRKKFNYKVTFILSSNDTHFNYILRSVRESKHIFVEKPLVINKKEFSALIKEIKNYNHIIHMNYNRRYSKVINYIYSEELIFSNKIFINYEINADNYYNTNDKLKNYHESGGALVGEGCHFIDLILFLNKNKNVIKYHNYSIDNNFTVSLIFDDGSIANILYTTNKSHDSYKEKITITSDNSQYQIFDFKELIINKSSKIIKKTFNCDKGHFESINKFKEKINTGINSDLNLYILGSRISLNIDL